MGGWGPRASSPSNGDGIESNRIGCAGPGYFAAPPSWLARLLWAGMSFSRPVHGRECATDSCSARVFGASPYCAVCLADDELVLANVRAYSGPLRAEAARMGWVLRWLSITVTRHPSGDLDPELANRLFHGWLVPKCVQGIIGVEVGPRHGNKHFQLWVLCYGAPDIAAHKRFINAAIRSACGMNSSGMQVTTKKFGTNQEPGKMSGYCTKDIGQGHFRGYVHGLSQNMIKSGIEEWQHVANTTLAGKTVLYRTTMPKTVVGWIDAHARTSKKEPKMDVVSALRLMCCSSHVPAPEFAMNGAGFDLARLNAYLRIVNSEDSPEVDDILTLFFRHDRRPFSETKDPATMRSCLTYEAANALLAEQNLCGAAPGSAVKDEFEADNWTVAQFREDQSNAEHCHGVQQSERAHNVDWTQFVFSPICGASYESQRLREYAPDVARFCPRPQSPRVPV